MIQNESPTKARRRKTNKHPEEKDMSERWLLTYADMITLLLGLFIVMYSISTVDAGKLKSVSAIIRGGFGLDDGGDSLVLDGSSGIIKDKDLVPKSQIYRLWERFQYSVKKLLISDKVLIDLQNNEELTLTLPASSLGEGNIKLSKETDELFLKLAEVTKDLNIEIILRVQIPYLDSIENKKDMNNWAYNSYRASVMAKFLSEKYGIPESRIAVQGLSGFRKNSSAETPEEAANQERIEIMIRKR